MFRQGRIHVDRRRFVAGTAAAAAALTIRPAFAEDAYPSHAITIINPFPPGGASDVVTRPLAAVLEPIIKQPVVIETKAGAAGAVGAQVAATSKHGRNQGRRRRTGRRAGRRLRQA